MNAKKKLSLEEMHRYTYAYLSYLSSQKTDARDVSTALFKVRVFDKLYVFA